MPTLTPNMGQTIEKVDPSEKTPGKWSMKAIVRKLSHILQLSDESNIAYVEGLDYYGPAKLKNRFQVGNKVVLIHKENIFLYEKPTEINAENIKILNKISGVNPMEETVIQSAVLDEKGMAYIAYAFFPYASVDSNYGWYNIHMLTINKDTNTITHQKEIIKGYNSDTPPELHLIGDTFSLTTHRKAGPSGDKILTGGTTMYQIYDPKTGAYKEDIHTRYE